MLIKFSFELLIWLGYKVICLIDPSGVWILIICLSSPLGNFLIIVFPTPGILGSSSSFFIGSLVPSITPFIISGISSINFSASSGFNTVLFIIPSLFSNNTLTSLPSSNFSTSIFLAPGILSIELSLIGLISSTIFSSINFSNSGVISIFFFSPFISNTVNFFNVPSSWSSFSIWLTGFLSFSFLLFSISSSIFLISSFEKSVISFLITFPSEFVSYKTFLTLPSSSIFVTIFLVDDGSSLICSGVKVICLIDPSGVWILIICLSSPLGNFLIIVFPTPGILGSSSSFFIGSLVPSITPFIISGISSINFSASSGFNTVLFIIPSLFSNNTLTSLPSSNFSTSIFLAPGILSIELSLIGLISSTIFSSINFSNSGVISIFFFSPFISNKVYFFIFPFSSNSFSIFP